MSTTANIEETFKWINKEYGSDIKDKFLKYLVDELNEHRDFEKEPLDYQNINWKEFNDEFKDFCKNYCPDPAQYFKEENLRHALYNDPYSKEAYNSREVEEISSIFDRKVTYIRKPEEYKGRYSELIEYMEEQRKVIEATSEALKLIRNKEVSQ